MPPQVPFYNATHRITNAKTHFRHPHPYNTNFSKSVSILKPKIKPTANTATAPESKHPITIPRSFVFSTMKEAPNKDPALVPEQTTNSDDVSIKDDEISVIPGPSYQVQEGTLKRVFLDKLEEKEFFIQLVMGQDHHSRRVLVMSDTRDSTANYNIQDTSVVALVNKKKIFPVVKVCEWEVAGQTINIHKYTIVDKVKSTLGNPKPIQTSFFNYLKNMIKKAKAGTDAKARVRCKTCIGCSKKSCRMGVGASKAPCTKCELNDKENCVRRKCVTWVEDVNLLSDHHPLRVRCYKCEYCNSKPCRNINKMCTMCKDRDKKRCLKRVCVDWTRYNITSSDIKEIEEQQSRIRDMICNPPSKVLLPSEDDQSVQQPQNIPGDVDSEPAVAVKKEKPDEEMTENVLDVMENKIEQVKEVPSSELNAYDIKTEIKAEEDDEDEDIEPTLFIAC